LTLAKAGTTFRNGRDIAYGGGWKVIANCPSCGTHYKHDPPKAKARARCGRCDAELDLARLSPYRIVSMAGSAAAVGQTVPGARTIHATGPHDIWQDEDPLPQIPEMAPSGAYDSALSQAKDGIMLQDESEATPGARPSAGGNFATFALWLAAGAIAGTGASWTLGGATATGLAAGSVLGAVAGWGWLRWTSPK
jgi:hypothetical protein